MNVENESHNQGNKPGAGSEGGKNITMAMIAKASGVSQGAISSLLNDRDYGIRVSPRTRTKVFRICREMGYIPNDLRAVVRMYPEKGDLCLLIDRTLGFEDALANQLLTALLQENSGRPVTVALYDPVAQYSDTPKAMPEPIRTGVASKFITLGTPNPALFQLLHEREHPVIHIGHLGTHEKPSEYPGVTALVPDYEDASRRAIEHLHAIGHRHIVVLSGPFGSTDPAVVELNLGVRDGFEAVGIPVEAQNILYGDSTFAHGVTSVELLWQRDPKPTALFCFSDIVAAGALHSAQERGIVVPGQLSIIGCGDSPFCSLLHPPLTTVALPVEEIASTAIEEIQRRLKEEDFTQSHRISITSRIIERYSSGSCLADGESRPSPISVPMSAPTTIPTPAQPPQSVPPPSGPAASAPPPPVA